MTDVWTDSNGGSEPAVPLNALPDPAGVATVREGVPTLIEVNDSFRALFEETAPLTVRAWWESGRLDSEGLSVESLCNAVVHGCQLDTDITVSSPADQGQDKNRTYRLRTGTTGDQATGDACLVLMSSDQENDEDVGAGRIASILSHDLRNPLDVAKAHLQAAKDTGGDEHFEQVNRAHNRMEQIIQDVLTLARGERAIGPTEPVDLSAVAAEGWENVDTECASLQTASDLPEIVADRDRLQRLFENLFRNSITHGSETDGETTIRICVGTVKKGFFVADDGIGIPSSDREAIFEPGYTSNQAGGTGLGLTIVEQIAKAHGWTVSATNGDCDGARFEFRGVALAE